MSIETGLLEAIKGYLEREKVNVAAGTALLQPQTWIYGQGMFSYCGGNELISTLITDDMLSTWLGTEGSDVDPHPVKLMGWIGPQGTSANSPVWEREGPCEDSPRVEHGKCELLYCFGEMSFSGADLSLLQLGLRGCDIEPRYVIRGPSANQRITDERMWQISLASFVLRQAYERMLVIGNRQTSALHFDGLQRLISTPVIDYRTGARCQDAEPLIVQWGANAMNNSICDYIRDIVRRIRTRARFLGGVAPDDIALVMTSLMRDALIDFVACGCGPCQGQQYNEVNVNPLESQRERARIATAGTFGQGIFEVDGIPVSILTNDWIPQTSEAPFFCSDIFVLTRRVGGGRALYMEHQDFASTLAGIPQDRLVQGAMVTDGGRFLTHSKNVNECFNETVYAKARMVLRTPWLQGRITDVCAPFNIPPMQPKPGDPYFFGGRPPTNPAAYAQLPYTYGPCGGWEDWSPVQTSPPR